MHIEEVKIPSLIIVAISGLFNLVNRRQTKYYNVKRIMVRKNR